MPKKTKILLVDANVLIDYQKSDLSILGLVNRHVGEVCILTTILTEVESLGIVDCERLGFRVIEPTLTQLREAATRRGQLSFRDRLCLLVARDGNFICMTNDKPLRQACREEGVSVIWGLEVMTALVREGKMRAADAVRTAEKIHLSNPLHIPRTLVDRLARIVTTIEDKRNGK